MPACASQHLPLPVVNANIGQTKTGATGRPVCDGQAKVTTKNKGIKWNIQI